MMRSARSLLISFLLVCAVLVLHTQPVSAGNVAREFYITFPENIREGSGPLDLMCYIVSEYNTTGTIELLGANETTVWKQQFTVNAQNLTQILIPHNFNNAAEIQTAENETSTRKAIHITSVQPVAVYGISQWQSNADGFLAIPVAAWGKNYRVEGYDGITHFGEYANSRATSQFAIVSAYDHTIVTIALTNVTMDGKGIQTHTRKDTLTVLLERGQVYQIQGLKNGTSVNDLTGSHVTSNKPVGVFGGSKCANVPKTIGSCNYLLEMIPPVETFGKEYYTYPFDFGRSAGDSWRAIPFVDGAIVHLNGKLLATIGPGDAGSPMYEVDDKSRPELLSPSHWSFTKPVLMGQNINGHTFDGSDHGDPSFTVLQPQEQFESGNIVFAVPPDSAGFSNCVNVIVQDSLGTHSHWRDSLVLDGIALRALPFPKYSIVMDERMVGTTYYVLNIKIPGGIHRLHAQSGFTASTMGYKNNETYAWPCSLALRTLFRGDVSAPSMPTQLTCGELTATLIDLPADTSVRTNLVEIGHDRNGIGWVYQHGKDSTYNFDSTVFADTNYMIGDSSALIHIKVSDLRNNAHGALYVRDKAGNDTTLYFDYLADVVVATPSALSFGKIPAGISKSDTVELRNPLTRPVRVDSLWPVNGTLFHLVGGASVPFTLAPSERRNLVVQYLAAVQHFDADTLMIRYDCFQQPLIAMFAGSGTPCIESADPDSGIFDMNDVVYNPQLTSIIKNVGTDTLRVSHFSFAGGVLSHYRVDSPSVSVTAPLVITPGDSARVYLTFVFSGVYGVFRDSLIASSNSACGTGDSLSKLSVDIILSDIKTVTELPNGWAITAFPNPFSGETKIAVTMPAGDRADAMLRVFDILGRECADLSEEIRNGENHIALTSAQLNREKAGTYVVVLSRGINRRVLKLLLLP